MLSFFVNYRIRHEFIITIPERQKIIRAAGDPDGSVMEELWIIAESVTIA